MRGRPRTLVAALAAPAVLASLVVAGALAPPAAAEDDGGEVVRSAEAVSDCDSGSFCVWTGVSYTGLLIDTTSTALSGTGIAVASSVRNRTARAARVYANADGSGASRCYTAGTTVGLTAVTARSFRILGGTGC
ncbi:peptidase inhibitor family I36 protein [Cellulomonas sp. PhB150]|uniref:peptidase inhibitor family I36 protein n=1 Tax=Cellulomonas sp. PhB150 TaxID=2485188 RepID=UPI000F96F38F|nr:peptidase inhibitor family I36 protein [Cellulomonas sp. PhB150]ROS21824.1 peptidase inhibitor family I36 [Cellulomonas sp. PhB150]